MAYRADHALALREALRTNWCPLRPLAPAPSPDLPPGEVSTEFLDALAKTLPRPEPSNGAKGSSPYRPTVGSFVHLSPNALAGTLTAVSHGPISAPWQVTSLAFYTGAPAFGDGILITATPDNATGAQPSVYGDFITNGTAYDAATGTTSPFVRSGSFGQPGSNGLSRIMSPGTFLTAWLYSAAGNTAYITIGVLEFTYVEVSPSMESPTEPRARYVAQVRPLPRPRTSESTKPRGFVISGPGFSRRIPTDLVDPVLLREWVVNTENGKSTPGMMPYWE